MFSHLSVISRGPERTTKSRHKTATSNIWLEQSGGTHPCQPGDNAAFVLLHNCWTDQSNNLEKSFML